MEPLRAGYLLLGLALLLGACSETDRPVSPAGSVACRLELQDSRYRALLAPGGIATVTEPPTASSRIGLRGLVVVHGLTGQADYFAYDLACPHELGQLVRLELRETQLDCPTCHSSYELLSGLGAPIAGPARSPLLRYRVHPLDRYRLLIAN